MRRLAVVFAVLLILLQPHGVDAPRRLIVGLFGESVNATAPIVAAQPGNPPAPPLPSVSLHGIFNEPPPSLARLDPKKITTLLATGDVIPARSVNYEMSIRNDFTYPFLKT